MYDAVANIYDNFFARSDEAYEFEATQTILRSQQNIEEEIWVLDFGCGTGSHASHILRKTQWNLLCFDVSEQMLAQAKEKLKNFSGRVIFCSDFKERLPVKASLAYSYFFVVNHIADEEDLMMAFNFIRHNCKETAKFFLDIYNDDLVKIDPPKNYRRENDGVIKSADVKRDDAGYRIRYSIDDKNIGEKIDSEIFVRGWSRTFIEKTFGGVITRNFNLNWDEIITTDYNYQYIVEITPND